ncbi:MAG: hypothetical protein GY913_31785 [Proteobacteria bacterium]|nr:hypothetical protein [Pseudomonadota bacterium]MCP4921503.1 hypothetical protein [Pseudomonadota bacterium]
MLLVIALFGCRNKDWSIEDSSIFEPVVEDTGPFDLDGDGIPASADCDDDDADIGEATDWYQDADEDGYGAGTATSACDSPDGYVADSSDCDDLDAAYHPGATEDDCAAPNDYNCDGSVGYADEDGDGFAACEECDDTSAEVNPDADEVCNGLDDDCDGTIDQGASDASTWYADADADGYGDASNTVEACTAPSGYLADDTDCDDTDADVSPAGSEVCNDVDDDCNGTVDDNASDATWWYEDADCDTYGDASTGVEQCDTPGDDWVEDDTDCDDADGLSYPGAQEVCLSVDNDCDGTVDNDCEDTTEITSPTDDPVDSPSMGAACALIGEMRSASNSHDYDNLADYMAQLDGTSSGLTESTEDDAVELDWSNRCGTSYTASDGNYTSTTNSWPTFSSTGTYGGARFRGYLNIGCGDDLNKTIGLMGNDALSLTIEGTEIMKVNWNDGQWKKFRYITFPEPGLYAFEVQWSTNLNCAIDPFELVWADGFVSGYGDYDEMCDYSSSDYATGTAIPGFAIIEGDALTQSTDGSATDCAQCASTSDCATHETCNTAGICE